MSRGAAPSARSPGVWTASALSTSTPWKYDTRTDLVQSKTGQTDFRTICRQNRQLFTSVCVLVPLAQTELLASCASDRSIVLYDMRESTPLKKVAAEGSSCCVSIGCDLSSVCSRR